MILKVKLAYSFHHTTNTAPAPEEERATYDVINGWGINENSYRQTECIKKSYSEKKALRNHRWHAELPGLLSELQAYLYPCTNELIRSSMGCTLAATSQCIQCKDKGPACRDCSISRHITARSQTQMTEELTWVGNVLVWTATSIPPWGNSIKLICTEGVPQHQRKLNLIQQ
jgi:hypothetical protein